MHKAPEKGKKIPTCGYNKVVQEWIFCVLRTLVMSHFYAASSSKAGAQCCFLPCLWSGDSSAPSSIPTSRLDWSAHAQRCVDEAAVGCSACYAAKMTFKCDSSGRWSRFPLWLPLMDAHLASSWTNLHFTGIKRLLQRDPARPTRAPRHSCVSVFSHSWWIASSPHFSDE